MGHGDRIRGFNKLGGAMDEATFGGSVAAVNAPLPAAVSSPTPFHPAAPENAMEIAHAYTGGEMKGGRTMADRLRVFAAESTRLDEVGKSKSRGPRSDGAGYTVFPAIK